MSMNNLTRQIGVSLIEILVTTLILGIGLLGVASLQVASVSSNQEGFFQSQATSIAEDYASRIRQSKSSEMVPWALTDHDVFVANFVTGGAIDCSAAPAMYCRSNGGAAPDIACSDGTDDIADMMAFDKWDICDIASKTLPDGKVRVSSTADMRLSIVVDWDSAKARSDLGQQTNVNSNCDAIIGDAERNCIIVELIP